MMIVTKSFSIMIIRRFAACIFATLCAFNVYSQGLTRAELAELASSLDGLKKEELKTAVYAISQPQTVLDYGSGSKGTWWGFWYTDRINTITNECFNRYSPSRFYFSSHDGTSISGMNIEHSFPKSWWGGTTYVNAYKDLFNLYPSDSEANSDKSNYPMGAVETVTSSSGEGYDQVGYATINGAQVKVWEPGDLFKGEFARSYFYMATTYQNYTWQGTQGLQELENNTWPTLQEWAYTLYLEWIVLDPVDAIEVERNQAVYEIQGNRNLFIDYPYLADYIWGDSTEVAFNPYASVTTCSDDDRYLSEVVISPPVFTPEGGTYYGEQAVTMRSSSPGTLVYYTTDGSDPTTSSTLFSDTLIISETTLLKAIAADDDNHLSDIASAEYIITATEGESTEGDTVFYFVETFDQCSGTGGNDGQWSGNIASSSFVPDNEGWSYQKAYGGDCCARFGTSSVTGTVTTPTFAISGTHTLTFVAAPWGSDGNALSVSVSGNATLSQSSFTLTAGEWTTFTLTLTGSGYVTLTFTPQKRFFLDDVRCFSLQASEEEEEEEGNEDDTDAIRLVEEDSEPGVWYDLNGRPCATPTRGNLYIYEGKKVLLK